MQVAGPSPEPIMVLDRTPARILLKPGLVARLTLRAGTRLRGLRGTAWITADDDGRDILLDPCDEWVLDHDERLLVCALHAHGAAEVQLDEPPLAA